MAINPIDFPSDKTVTLSHSSLNHYKHGNLPARRLVKMDSGPIGSISNLPHKHGKYRNYSPYLKNSNHRILGDSVQLLSRVTEKRFVHKNGRNLMSLLPLAGNIYKANSGEFQAKQTNKKVLKSVLTLPNNAAPALQLGTVSDINDSEYLSGKENLRKKCRKRNPQIHLRKYFPRSKGMESESQCCSDTDLHIDTSSLDMLKKCGDGKRFHKPKVESKGNVKEKVKPHDVWAVLRNMNRFQFQTSPRFSDDGVLVSKQKTNLNRRKTRNDMRVFETRRTEEIAYLTSYEVPKSVKSLSHCSSFDKVTVIDRSQNLKIGKEIEDKPKPKKKTGKLLGPRAIKSSSKNKALPSKQRNNWKAITNVNQTYQKKNENVAHLCNMDDPSKMMMFDRRGYYGELDGILNNNASVDLGYESKTTENDEDFSTFNRTTTNTTQASQCSQSKLSDNSGSSKAAAFTKNLVHNKVKTKRKVEPAKQINGITKVILCRGQNMEKSQHYDSIPIDQLKRNVNQAMVTHNNSGSPPKLTKTEINRQLHKYKFPVIILGKDQLRSTIHVVNSDHPQFDGLDQQVWPFMRSWYGIERPVKVTRKQYNANLHNKKTKIEEIEKKIHLKNNITKPVKVPDKIPKPEHQRIPLPLSELINQTQQRKLKPIRQLKDRMIKLLYKNSSAITVVDPPGPVIGKNGNNIMTQSVDISTDTRDKNDASTNNTTEKVKKLKTEKRSWAKAKWASDFIETVIKKVKSGAYYNQDVINKVCNEIFDIDKKEIDVQTDSITGLTPILSSNANNNYNKTFDEDTGGLIEQIPIPGFDNVLPVLEIKNISLNEVAVKHCGNNIMVHFDVIVPTNSIVSVKRDSSVIPVDITKSLTKVFKCKTSIINAMLPAELCSIVPNMLREIVDTGQHLSFFTTPIDLPELTTISEVSNRSESIVNIPTPALTLPAITLPILLIPPKLRQQLNGGYFKDVNTTQNFHILRKTSYFMKYESRLSDELRPKIERNLLFDIESHLNMPLKVICNKEPKVLPAMNTVPIEQINTCTALQPYPVTNYTPISMLRFISLMNLFETMSTYINNTCLRMIKTDNNLSFNFNMEKSLSIPRVVTLRIGVMKADTLNDFSNCLTSCKIRILPDTDKTKSVEEVKLSALCGGTPVNDHPKSKGRRKSYLKLYRKSKSSSYINGEKTIQLDRITNLDDFFQVFGPGKLLSSVFDGQSSKKIMSSIKELKKWTTEINPTQALLVVLLANKIETPNVLRYRPMLLQGIAVKRITKAIELDMEIEVIKRENLNGTPQFEGITYLPASVENQDRLYEELCWIAKNTASDYQRPFDHASEKLLKSLLEKRKQLNPSYLRVMARYVGLGLLKSPGKRQ